MENTVEKININDKITLAQNSSENIKNLIYTIRGKQVMLDSDVAMLYQCETRIINQAVKRNINRFPDKFCFRLTNVEYKLLEQNKVLSEHEEKFEKVFDELQKNEKEELKQKIFFDGRFMMHIV